MRITITYKMPKFYLVTGPHHDTGLHSLVIARFLQAFMFGKCKRMRGRHCVVKARVRYGGMSSSIFEFAKS